MSTHLQCDNISFPLRFVGISGPQEAPVSWLEFVLPFLRPLFRSLPVPGFLRMLLDLNGRTTCLYVPNESHFSGCQIQSFDKSMFFPYIRQFCCPTGIWEHVIFHPDLLCWITQHISWPSNPARFVCCVRLCARSMFSLVAVQTVSNLASLENVHRHPLTSSWSFASQERSPKAVARKLATNRNVERGHLERLGRYLPTLAHVLSNTGV